MLIKYTRAGVRKGGNCGGDEPIAVSFFVSSRVGFRPSWALAKVCSHSFSSIRSLAIRSDFELSVGVSAEIEDISWLLVD